MIFITGDTHGDIDLGKLSSKRFTIGKKLTREDYVIICGDTAIIWDNGGFDRYIQKWYASKPWTTLFVDGNHENHELLNRYPVSVWHGGYVHRIRDNIIHLMRGQIYNIDGKIFFTMGGAMSHDMKIRKAYVDWWPQEIPSASEWLTAFSNLDKVGRAVDYVISHEAPLNVVQGLLGYSTGSPVAKQFNALIDGISYKHWYFGHHHCDVTGGKFTCCYNKVIKLEG